MTTPIYVDFRFDIPTVQLLVEALSDMPYKRSASVIDALSNAANAAIASARTESLIKPAAPADESPVEPHAA